jgi:hypothetical protein
MELTKVGLLCAKLESAYGTDATPNALDNNIAICRAQATIVLDGELTERDNLNPGFGPSEGALSLPAASIKFSAELRGNRTNGSAADISSGSDTHPIELDPLLRACGLPPVYTTESVLNHRDGCVTYYLAAPPSTPVTCTIYFYTQHQLFKFVGAVGNLESILFEPGKFPILSFAFTGFYSAPTTADLPSATWLATKPPLVSGSTLRLSHNYGGTILVYPNFHRLEFKLNNQIAKRLSAAVADVTNGFALADQNPTLDLSCETLSEAANGLYAVKATSTRLLFNLAVGADTGNMLTLTASGLISKISHGDQNGLRTLSLSQKILALNQPPSRASALAAANSSPFQLIFS